MGEKLLEISNLHKQYGAQAALKDVTFNLEAGKIVGLLGPNGSGKTTMLKIINNLLQDYEGSVKICGHAPGIESKKLISYLPDRLTMPSWLKVRQAIRMYKDFFGDFDMPRANAMLVQLGVPQEKRISELSKGMREKLQLTLTMARKARIYILDEPIAGVDPASREIILSTILNNFGENSSILLSTHIISDVESIFDQVVFLKEGSVNLVGDAEELRAKHGKSIDQLFREVYKCC